MPRTPQTSVDGERWEPMVLAEHEPCGMIGSGPERVVKQQVAVHFAVEHKMVGGVLIEGRDFTMREAPERCDFCGNDVALPYWIHRTSGRIVTEVWGDGDGVWIVCDTCHHIVAERNVSRLVRRCIAAMKERSPYLAQGERETDARADIAAFCREVIKLLDAGRRVTLDTP